MRKRGPLLAVAVAALLFASAVSAEQKSESFDEDPGWDGLNNRSTTEKRPVRQDFGYLGPEVVPGGAIGGTISPDGTPAYYAKSIESLSLDDPLHASGTLLVKPGGGNVLLGFFNADSINEWRTPNSMVFRINGRGETFHVHTEYATRTWRAGAGVIGKFDPVADRVYPVENPSGKSYRWTLDYDPNGNAGAGQLVATLNDMKAEMAIHPDLRKDGATFNRFGLLTVVKHADDGGDFVVGDLRINGETIDLTKDPQWDAVGNHASYFSEETRPRFNFGYSKTQNAGGKSAGEIGGLFFRGDCRYPDRLAYYGAKTAPLTSAKKLSASGKISFHRGVSDSTTIFGFFNSVRSVNVNESQKHALPCDFMGFAIEGPSAQGFFAYPTYRMQGDASSQGRYEGLPYIFPDGTSHDWTLTYDPGVSGSEGSIRFTLDNNPPVILAIPSEHVAEGASYNRFGFVTPWIDGNGQIVYLDDLTYTVKQ
mgnify:CR=1 FL=1